MLCDISVVFNSLGDVFALVSCQRGSENRQVIDGSQRCDKRDAHPPSCSHPHHVLN